MFDKKFKLLMVYINGSQAGRFEEFLEKIGIYHYASQDEVRRGISENIKHKKTKVWPGTDALFNIPVEEKILDEVLVKFKTFRMALPKGIIMSVAIIPFDRIIPSLYLEDLEVEEDLLKELEKEYTK